MALKHLVDPSRRITYGIVQAGPDTPDGVPYIRPADMSEEHGVLDQSTLLRTTQEIAAAYRRSEVRTGDLVCSIGPSFGKVMVVPEALHGANLTQGTARITPQEGVVARFIFWALRCPSSVAQWESGIGGATFRALNLEPLARTLLPTPPPAEQAAIAAFLDRETAKIDALVEEQRRLIGLLKKKRQAIISRALTKGLEQAVPMKDSGVAWVGDVPAHWECCRLRHIADLNPSKSETAELSDDFEISFLPMEAIGEKGELDLSRTRAIGEVRNGYSYFANGDVVFAKVTPCFENGKGALMKGLVGGCGFGTTELTTIRAHQTEDGPFLWWLTCAPFFRGPGRGEMTGAGGLKRVPDEFAANFVVPWPPASERLAITIFLDEATRKIDALVAEAERATSLLYEHRSALISAAVTGKIDVRGKVPIQAEAA